MIVVLDAQEETNELQMPKKGKEKCLFWFIWGKVLVNGPFSARSEHRIT